MTSKRDRLHSTPSAMARLKRLVADRSGASAIEFALVLPILLVLFFGTAELTQGVTIYRKVTIVARSLADLVSRTTTVTNADKDDIFKAATAVVAPFDASKLKIVVSSIAIDAQGAAKIAWSDAQNATPRAKNATVALPPGLTVPNRSLIWAEVEYTYTPPVQISIPQYGAPPFVISGPKSLKDDIYMSPRLSDSVIRQTS